jgi:hypothetical protein
VSNSRNSFTAFYTQQLLIARIASHLKSCLIQTVY